MASPTLRASTAPVAGLSTTSPGSTEIGDLVVVHTWERAGAGIPTHTLQSGFTEILSHGHNDGSTDGRLSVAYKVATSAGAVAYQAYTSSVGTETWTGSQVITKDTYGLAITAASVTATGTGAPDPPAATANPAWEYLVLAISAWHLSASQTLTPAHATYTLQTHVSGAATGDVAVATLAVAAGSSSINPGAYTDNQTPNGTCSITVCIPEPAAAGETFILQSAQVTNTSGAGSQALAFSRAVQPGSTLICTTSWNGAGSDATPTCDDNVNPAWTEIGSHFFNSSDGMAMFYRANSAGGSAQAGLPTVTITFNTTTGAHWMSIMEVWGLDSSAPLDDTTGQAATASTGANNATSGALTPSVDNCLLVGALYGRNSATIAAGTDYTSIQEDDAWEPTDSSILEAFTQSTAASKAATATIADSTVYFARLAVFKPPSGGTQFNETPSDTLSLSEADQLQARKALGEVLVLTEDQTVQTRKTILETVGLTESLRRVVTHPMAETLSLSENLGAIKVVLRDVDDTLSLSEQLGLAVSKVNGLAETISLTETLSKQASRTAAETLQLTENLTTLKLVIRDIPETLSLTEQLQLMVRKQASIAETLGLAEQLARETRKNLTDTVALTENLATLKFILRPLSDTLLLSENLSLLVRKSQSIAETVLLAEDQALQANKRFAETIGLSENLAALKAVLADRADALSLNETLTRLVTRATAETVTLTEADTLTVRKTLAELAAFTEQLVASVIKTKTLGDTVSLTEAQRRQIGKAVQDTLGLTETRLVTIAKSFQEQVNLAEEFLAFFIPAGGFVELVQVTAQTYRIATARAEAYAVPGATVETMRAPRVLAEVGAIPGLIPGSARVPGATAETYGASS